jgi:phytoene desaturase
MRAPRKAHAIVIGAGFGGLAAGIRLAARGYQVTLLDRLDAPGGRAFVYRQDGYTFDAGPTIITVPHLLEELWTLCGQRMSDHVTLKSLDPFYKIRFNDGEIFNYRADPEAMKAEVARLSPGDLPGLARFMAHADAACRIGFEGLSTTPFTTVIDMLRALPGLSTLGAWNSVHHKAASCFKDPRLQAVFSFHPLLVGGNPFNVTAIYTLINALERRWGVHFAMGGTGAVVQGLVDLFQGQGGILRLNNEVRQIRVEDGRACGVELSDGEFLPADIVVSNADAAWTYRMMLPEAQRKRWTNRKVENSDFSMGLFVWYFGTDKRYDDVGHHTIMLGPRYRELLRDIFKRKVLAPDFSLYLHRPTATDPSLAPEGCDAWYVLSPVPHLGSGHDWEKEAEPYRQRIQERLEATLVPDLGRHLTTSRVLHPGDFRSRYLALNGAGFSLEPSLTQSAWFRPHNVSEDVRDLYLVGAGTHPGAGVPGVLCSAQILDKVVPPAHVFVR